MEMYIRSQSLLLHSYYYQNLAFTLDIILSNDSTKYIEQNKIL